MSQADSVAALLEFIAEGGEAETARGIAEELGLAGVLGSMTFGLKVRKPAKPVAKPAADLAEPALVKLQIEALDKALAGFDDLLERVARRLRRGSRLRLGANVVTAVTSSALVISVTKAHPIATGVLGGVALVGALAAVLAGWLSGDTNLATRQADIAAKAADARQLRGELEIYLTAKAPAGRVEKRLEDAAGLVRDLTRFRAELKAT
jgi:hypothetical protein